MKPFASAFDRIGTENAFAVGPEIAGWAKKGFDIVRLNIGEPGADIPKAGTAAGIKSFQNHQTHYMSSRGADRLVEETARYLEKTRKISYSPDDIVFGPGGKPVIPGTIMILTNPADEVIYPSPGYPIYESIIDLVGAKGVPIILRENKGFRFDIKDLKKLINRRTKLLILNSPSNPTGGVLTTEDYAEIAKLAKKHDFYILSDESYARIAFGAGSINVTWRGREIPVTESIVNQPDMAERTIILDGFSKTYSMPGLRVGFAASKNKKFMDKFLTFAINFWSCLPAPCMEAALGALTSDQKEALKEVNLYKEKRDTAVSMLNEIDGIRCHSPAGAFYLFPNVTGVCKKKGFRNGEEFRKYLLSYDKKNKKGVAVLARIHFGKKLPGEREEYIRISFAGTLESLKEGVKRIKEAIA